MRSREAGYSVLEPVIAVVVMGMLVGMLMPALTGYQSNAAVKSAVQLAATQLRETQQLAMSENQQINILYTPSDTYASNGWQGWEICSASANCAWQAGDKMLFKASIPTSVNITANCYRGAFAPTGQYVWWTGACGASAATPEIVCFNSKGSSPTKMYIRVAIATGEMTISGPASGGCP